MKERIDLLIKTLNMSPSQFADEIGIQRSGISHILSGRNNPSLEFVLKILTRFPEIRSEWVLFGSGSMMKTGQEWIPTVVSPKLTERDLFSTPERTENSMGKEVEEFSSKPNKFTVPVENDLHAAEKEKSKIDTLIEETASDKTVNTNSNPQMVRKINKIVLFYNDYSFEEFSTAK